MAAAAPPAASIFPVSSIPSCKNRASRSSGYRVGVASGVDVGMAEGVERIGRVDLDPERVAFVLILDRDEEEPRVRVPEQRDIDAVRTPAVELTVSGFRVGRHGVSSLRVLSYVRRRLGAKLISLWSRLSAELSAAVRQRELLRAVVLNVRNPPAAQVHGLEDDRLTLGAVGSDPVDADDEPVFARGNELGSAGAAIAGAGSGVCSLCFEDRPGLLRPASARGAAPPQEAAFDAAPLGVGVEQCSEVGDVATVRSLVCAANVIERAGFHEWSISCRERRFYPPSACRAYSAASRSSRPNRRPSEVVTGRVVRSWRRIRSTACSSSRLGRTVLGPGVIASSTVASSLRARAPRPSRPSTTCSAVTTKHVSQPAALTRARTSASCSSSTQVGTSRRRCAPTRVSLPPVPSSGSPADPQSALPAA